MSDRRARFAIPDVTYSKTPLRQYYHLRCRHADAIHYTQVRGVDDSEAAAEAVRFCDSPDVEDRRLTATGRWSR